MQLIEIKCTKSEQTLLKQSIKRDGCSVLCDFKPQCNKQPNETCGEYIVSLIKWEVINE